MRRASITPSSKNSSIISNAGGDRIDIEDILEGYDGLAVPVEQSPLEVTRSGSEDLLSKYRSALHRFKSVDKVTGKAWLIKEQLKSDVDDVLWPSQIAQFFQMTADHDGQRNYAGITGMFLSRLVQNAYADGHSHFRIDARGADLDLFGSYLEGKAEEPIFLIVAGDLGNYTALYANHIDLHIRGGVGRFLAHQSAHAKYNARGSAGVQLGHGAHDCDFTIDESVDKQCGSKAKKSRFMIRGSASWGLGWNAEESTFVIKKNVGPACGASAKDCTFDIGGSVAMSCGVRAQHSEFDVKRIYGSGVGSRAKHCTFKTYDQQVMESVLKNVAANNTNFVQRLDRSGRIERLLRR